MKAFQCGIPRDYAGEDYRVPAETELPMAAIQPVLGMTCEDLEVLGGSPASLLVLRSSG